MTKGYIYFISDNDGHIKIGVTEDINRRMKQLQTGNASKLELLHHIDCGDMDTAYDLEAKIHRKLKEHRVNGEWFQEGKVRRMINRPWVRVGGYRFRGRGNIGHFAEIALTILITAFVICLLKGWL